MRDGRVNFDKVHRSSALLIEVRLLMQEQPGRHNLSTRQRQVLALLLEGASDKEIASGLHISRATAHEHVLTLFRHFGVNSRAKLLACFIRRKISNKAL